MAVTHAWRSGRPKARTVLIRQRLLRRLARAEEGQDLIEYGLLAALIAVFAMAAVTAMGQQLDAVLWQTIANNF